MKNVATVFHPMFHPENLSWVFESYILLGIMEKLNAKMINWDVNKVNFLTFICYMNGAKIKGEHMKTEKNKCCNHVATRDKIWFLLKRKSLPNLPIHKAFNLSGWEDLNFRPHAPQTRTLPTELHPELFTMLKHLSFFTLNLKSTS